MKVFEPGTAAFVLMIKCYLHRHGKRDSIGWAEGQVERLQEAGAYGMEVVHLFSNRIGARIIVGFIFMAL